MTIQRVHVAVGLIAAIVVSVLVSMASCAPPAPNVVPHTFQQAQKIDVVCIQVNNADGTALQSPVPVAQAQCAPVPANVNGATLPYHLYALVTQTTPGELAVVDLTAGNVVDVDRNTPGVDFIPVGANPTDVAVAQDAAWTFVSSGDPNKWAIYAIDNKNLLGNSTGTNPPPPLRLTDLPACALPQRPQALAVVPTASAPDAGGATGSYVLVALLGASAGMPAAVVTIDPLVLASAVKGSLASCTSLHAVLAATALSGDLPLSWAPGPAWPDGVPYADASGPTPVPQCMSSIVDAAPIDNEAGAGDAGAEAAGTGAAGLPLQPPHPTSMAMRLDAPLLYIADEAVPVIHVIDLHDPAHPIELDPLLATSVADPGRRVAVGGIAISPTTRDYKTYLYAIDAMQGTLMVYDITDPASSQRTPLERPHPELNPLAPLDRIGFSAPVAAVAFAQHDWSLPSQADPYHQYTGLLCNPNPNAHPTSGAFVDLGAYYRADRAGLLIQSMDTQGGTVQSLPTRLRGVFGFVTLSNGNVVTIDVDDWDAPCRRPDPMSFDPVADPSDPTMTPVTYGGGVTGALDIPEPAPAPGDLDPYHAPITYSRAIPESAAVTLEAFFPVSAPHRPRSNSLLRSDPINGFHVPNLIGVPQLLNAAGAPVATSGPGGTVNPLLLPAPMPPGFVDPTYVRNPTEPNPSARGVSSPGLASASPLGAPIPAPLFPGGSNGGCSADAGACGATSPPGVRVSFDDSTVHQDQDWTVTYEGALPTVGGIVATIASTLSMSDPAAYETLLLSTPGAGLCARGIEDWSIGQARASQVLAELTHVGLPQPPALSDNAPPLPQWTSDYVEIADDILGSGDQYWSEPSSANDCWDGALADRPEFRGSSPLADARYNFCQQTFGAASDADTHLARDLPILHAKDESLEVGRFGWYPTDTSSSKDGGAPAAPVAIPELTTNRVVVPADPSNKPFLRLARCCFHHQATFKVRTGGEWVAVGSGVGLLHRIVKDSGGSCVSSCDPRAALMNARAFDIPWSSDPKTCPPAAPPSFDRDSPLAMRNPMFSFVMWSGCGLPPGSPVGSDHTLATRDLVWKFSMRGSFSPLTVSVINPNNGSAVSPQSMRFIRPLGQLAVVDGEIQGLVLIDLNLVAVVRSYF